MSQQGMRTFSTEFKKAVVLRLEAGERIAAVSDELKIRRKLLYEVKSDVDGFANLQIGKRGLVAADAESGPVGRLVGPVACLPVAAEGLGGIVDAGDSAANDRTDRFRGRDQRRRHKSLRHYDLARGMVSFRHSVADFARRRNVAWRGLASSQSGRRKP